MRHYLTSAIAAVALTAVSAISASAATITVGALPLAAIMNPTAASTSGTVFENVTGSTDVRLSAWSGTTVDPDALDSFYTSVSARSSATYTFGSAMESISFLWGSADDYNDLTITLGGGSTVINGADVFGAASSTPGVDPVFVTISDPLSFRTVTFSSSTRNAFEYANVTVAPVPLPASALLLLAGIGGLAAARRKTAAA